MFRKSSLYVYKFSFSNTSNTYRVFSNYFWPCGRLEGDCCLKSLKEKQIILYSQHLPKKNYSFFAPRIEKNTRNILKITLSWKLSRFFCAAYHIYLINRPGHLLNFWTLRVGTYLRWVLIRGWALIKFPPFSASEECLFCNKTINANKTWRSNKARFL